MYKLIKDENNNIVAIQKDKSFIPLDESNTDYQAYLKFLEEGNQPLPAEEQA